ncbi:hypothetical protein F4813DRAFT_363833 [Daldinia decipiens]|uniref:uncharacterized protein n=1 Tax=Daldinia decipiens TaxID=326647 RepID=UPI0020C3062B|nr:uncharacterized protein F4813DRAFT_363833 [Daldinia decipiens]KAI1656619.1 hypothetical protein F4813DRAFT_363833 [Daldinia decipiens]
MLRLSIILTLFFMFMIADYVLRSISSKENPTGLGIGSFAFVACVAFIAYVFGRWTDSNERDGQKIIIPTK